VWVLVIHPWSASIAVLGYAAIQHLFYTLKSAHSNTAKMDQFDQFDQSSQSYPLNPPLSGISLPSPPSPPLPSLLPADASDASNALLLPPLATYPSKVALFEAIQSWSKLQGYAFTIIRSKRIRDGRQKVYYACDRSFLSMNIRTERVHNT
jgi:hypothetical protein